MKGVLRRLFRRDPVVTIAVLTSAVIGALPLLNLGPTMTGAVTATLTAAAGAASAAMVSVDRALPLLVGLAKSVLALLLTLGVHVPENYAVAVMAFLTVVAGLATRPQVGAVEPPRDRDGNIINVTGVLDTMTGPLPIPRLDPEWLREMSDRDFVEFTERMHAARAAAAGPGSPYPTEQRESVPRPPDTEATQYTSSQAALLRQNLDRGAVFDDTTPGYYDDAERQRGGGQQRGRHWQRRSSRDQLGDFGM